MRRLLVANRGEIAKRVARAARERALPAVAVATREDEALAARYGANEIAPVASYADAEALLEVARSRGCDAVHPGYGFLSESAAFSRACGDAGLLFVGAPPAALALWGDKIAARDVAVASRVPVARGAVVRTASDLEAFLADAESAILKARTGGGGRGIREVARGDDLSEAMALCAAEGGRAFGGDDAAEGLVVEELVRGARHVEVQVVADASGAASHLWDRDCSLQRRHQKLVEIAPAGLAAETRRALLDASIELAKASGLVGLGTFEFLVTEDAFFFCECNPRLQVEHTVTELISGVDLVETQLSLAEGRTLASLGLVDPPAARGVAVQARLYAEKQSGGPSVAPIKVFEPPTGAGVRVDTAYGAGLAAHPSYDALLAKIVTHAADRGAAVAKCRLALSDFVLDGPETNAGLLAALLDCDEVVGGSATTTFVEELDFGRGGAEAGRGGAADATEDDEGLATARAPAAGTLRQIVAPGTPVVAGETIAIIESMKMELVVAAPATGDVDAVLAATGDIVAEDDALLLVSGTQTDGSLVVDGDDEADLDAARDDLDALRRRLAKLEDEARPKAVERRRSRGQLTAREHVALLCDTGSFVEYGGLAVAAQRRARSVDDLEASTPADGVITGVGSVDGVRTAVVAVDATVLAGTQGVYHHLKIDRICNVATKERLPIVLLPEGGGGRPNDGDVEGLTVAGLYIDTWRALAGLKGAPRVAVVSGYCFAGSAALAGCSDLLIATENASLGMAGPAMIEGGGLGVVAPGAVGPARDLAAVGTVHVVERDDAAAIAAAKRYLSFFSPAPRGDPDDSGGGSPGGDQRRLRRLVPENRKRAYDIRRIVDVLVDAGSALELRAGYGGAAATFLARIDGRAVGVLASDTRRGGGAVDADAADKAAAFFRHCEKSSFPIVVLVDTPGFMVGPDEERRGMLRYASDLFAAGAEMRVPMCAVVLRKAVGLGAMALCGGSTRAPADTFAWPSAELSAMGVEGAVRLGFKAKLAAASDEDRPKLFEKLCSAMYARGAATEAASCLEVDAVVDPAETRERIAACFAGRATRGVG